MHILDVFSGQGDRIEMIPFLLSQASWDTSVDDHIIITTYYFKNFEIPLIYNKIFSNILLYIGHHIRYLLKIY